MEKNEAAFLPMFDGSALWDEKGTYSVLSEDGATRKSFFITPPDAERLERLFALANERRPDKSGDKRETTFLTEHILWPCQVLFEPRPCVIWPSIPKAFLFGKDSSPDKALSAIRQGHPRKSVWFLSDKSRATMTRQEGGDSSALLTAMADLARAVAFLHNKGFACYGLSDENVLLDAANGRAFLTGTENFRAPDFPSPAPSVPMAYAAPELVSADLKERAPDLNALRNADLHALAVLFYRLLLHRHPLVGPKRRDDALTYGSEALFIENPNDKSNRPDNLGVTIQNLGDPLESLFLAAFTHGLQDPRERPTAIQWKNALETARRRHEARKRNIDITKKTSFPLTRPEILRDASALPQTLSPAGAESVNLSKTAGEDASRLWKITLEWEPTQNFDFDISAFLLRKGDVQPQDMVFYGALTHVSNSVRLLENVPADSPQKVQKIMVVERNLIPPDISRIDFVVTAYYTGNLEYGFKAVKNALLSVYDESDNVRMRINLSKDFGDCSVCEAASLFQENGRTTLTKKGKGYGGGLQAVCSRYGIRVM